MQGYTIIIPVYNEQELIEKNTLRLLSYLRSAGLGHPFEIIISSNGSTDRTAGLGRKLAKQHKEITFLEVPERGAGLSFRQAVTNAKYRNIISVDMDLSVDMDFIPKAAKLLEKSTIIVGSKKTGSQQRSFLRTIPSAAFIWLTRIFLGIGYTDYSMAAKAYRTGFLRNNLDYIDGGTSYVINMIYLAKKQGEKITEIPVFCDDRRKSRFNLINEIFYRLIRLVKLWWMLRIRGKGYGKE